MNENPETSFKIFQEKLMIVESNDTERMETPLFKIDRGNKEE